MKPVDSQDSVLSIPRWSAYSGGATASSSVREFPGSQILSTARMNFDILPGDWWLVRQRELRTPIVRSSRRDSQSEDHSPRPLTMAELSEKAAKFCFRLHELYLQGVPKALRDLQPGGRPVQADAVRNNEISRRLDLGGKRIEQLKQGRDIQRFTVDHLYKIAALQGVSEPAPCVLEWGAVLTWLVLHVDSLSGQPEGKFGVPGGSVPLECVVYAACALSLIKPLRPTGTASESTGLSAEQDAAKWQIRALDVCTHYLARPRRLLSGLDERRLAELLHADTVRFFRIAEECSERLRSLPSLKEVVE